MNTGIQDSWNLRWKLALVDRGVADEALLRLRIGIESYGQETTISPIKANAPRRLQRPKPPTEPNRWASLSARSRLGVETEDNREELVYGREAR
jgi:hypothetical protein